MTVYKNILFFVFIFSFIIFAYFGCEQTPDLDLETYAYVYKTDNSRQCDPSSGTDLDETAKELIGIQVVSQIKGIEDKTLYARCEGETGRINIYQIFRNDLPKALQKNFTELPESLLWEVDY